MLHRQNYDSKGLLTRRFALIFLTTIIIKVNVWFSDTNEFSLSCNELLKFILLIIWKFLRNNLSQVHNITCYLSALHVTRANTLLTVVL